MKAWGSSAQTVQWSFTVLSMKSGRPQGDLKGPVLPFTLPSAKFQRLNWLFPIMLFLPSLQPQPLLLGQSHLCMCVRVCVHTRVPVGVAWACVCVHVPVRVCVCICVGQRYVSVEVWCLSQLFFHWFFSFCPYFILLKKPLSCDFFFNGGKTLFKVILLVCYKCITIYYSLL